VVARLIEVALALAAGQRFDNKHVRARVLAFLPKRLPLKDNIQQGCQPAPEHVAQFLPL
jgi:hypothetical protein